AVLDREGRLLLANRGLFSLLRAGSRADCAAAIAAERGPFASVLRQLAEAPDEAEQVHTLPLRTGSTRRAIEFTGRRVALPSTEPVFLLVANEPANGANQA